MGHDYKRKRGELETCSQEREPAHAKRSAGELVILRLYVFQGIQDLEQHPAGQMKRERTSCTSFAHPGFLKEIDGVRKEKERLTAAKLF